MAYEFNGTNQYLDTASTPVTEAPLTLACWFYTNNATTNMRIAGIYQAGQVQMFDIVAAGANAGDPILMVVNAGAGASNVTATTNGFQANKWHHACAVFSSNSNRTVFLDAGGSASSTVSITPVGLNSISIGRRPDGSFATMNGRIAEVGIWSAALTAAEIASLAKGITCDKIRPQSLVFYAPLIRDLIDTKGRAITNNNGATVANHPRIYP